jgi:hypothetical protein
MTKAEGLECHDDRAWPRGAVPVSFLIGLAAVGAGIAVTAASNHVPLAGLSLLMGLAVGSLLIVIGMSRWLSGQAFPSQLGIVAGLASVGGGVLAWFTGFVGPGGAFLMGLAGGCMLANIWAIRAARRNRQR